MVTIILHKGTGPDMENGKIFFVGAGTGYVCLLTVKSRQVLLKADVVVYDKAVGDEIVALISDNATKIFIDEYEKAGHEEIYRILEEHAKQGKRVVCLNSSDSFWFEFYSDNAQAFADAGISVEIISGVLPDSDCEKFPWYENLPLSGWNIFVTRPREMSRRLVTKLRMLGARVLEIPTVRLMLVENDTITSVILKHIWDYQWIIFTSQVGVDAFFRQAKKRNMDARKFSACKFGVVGAETKKRLAFYGITADLMPEIYTVKELGKVLAKKMRRGERALLVREHEADKELIRKIGRMSSVLIEDMTLYKTVSRTPSDLPEGIQFDDYFKSDKTIVIFSSESEVNGFSEIFNEYDFDRIKAVCAGEQTFNAAVSSGMQATLADNEATADLIVELVEKLVDSDNSLGMSAH